MEKKNATYCSFSFQKPNQLASKKSVQYFHERCKIRSLRNPQRFADYCSVFRTLSSFNMSSFWSVTEVGRDITNGIKKINSSCKRYGVYLTARNPSHSFQMCVVESSWCVRRLNAAWTSVSLFNVGTCRVGRVPPGDFERKKKKRLLMKTVVNPCDSVFNTASSTSHQRLAPFAHLHSGLYSAPQNLHAGRFVGVSRLARLELVGVACPAKRANCTSYCRKCSMFM